MQVNSSAVLCAAVNLLLVGLALAATVQKDTSAPSISQHEAHAQNVSIPTLSVVSTTPVAVDAATAAATKITITTTQSTSTVAAPAEPTTTTATATTTTAAPVPEALVIITEVAETTTGSSAPAQGGQKDTPADLANFASGQVKPSNFRTDEPSMSLQSVVPKTPDMVDLSWPLDNDTLHWPTNEGFKYITNVDKKEKLGDLEYYHKSDSIKMAIHTGTHIDAPIHFSENGQSVEQIPLRNLAHVPVQVINLLHKVRGNHTYQFTKEDFLDASTKVSLVREGVVLLVYTGISDWWDQGSHSYFDYANATNIETMRVPGFTLEAAKFLVSAKVVGVGLDAPSADSQRNSDGKLVPLAHVEFNEHNIFIIENISRELLQLVDSKDQWRLFINPLPIVGASGSPIRLVAIKESHLAVASSGSAPVMHPWMPILLLVTFVYAARRWIGL